MMRRLWVAAAIFVPLLVVSVPVTTLAAIWLDSGRLGATSAVLLALCLPTVPTFFFWTDAAKPEPNLPRRDRARLRDEQRRIRLDAEVARMEREAGLS